MEPTLPPADNKICDDCGRGLHPSDWIICTRCERDRDRRMSDFN